MYKTIQETGRVTDIYLYMIFNIYIKIKYICIFVKLYMVKKGKQINIIFNKTKHTNKNQ